MATVQKENHVDHNSATSKCSPGISRMGRHGGDQFTKLLFANGYMFSVPLDASLSAEVVLTRKSNTIRHFPCTVLQCPIVLITLKVSLVSTTVSTLNRIEIAFVRSLFEIINPSGRGGNWSSRRKYADDELLTGLKSRFFAF